MAQRLKSRRPLDEDGRGTDPAKPVRERETCDPAPEMMTLNDTLSLLSGAVQRDRQQHEPISQYDDG